VREEINSQRKPKVENNESSDKKTGKFLEKPKKHKKCWVRLDGLSSSIPLDVCLIEIDDASWWEHKDNVNPFGARLWPPSLALAKFLAKYPLDVNHQVIEVGCGTGLISIVAAASGATAIATDVSDVALSLVKEGWSETSLRLHKTKSPIGNLTVSSFDVFSNDPLPFQKLSGKQQESSSILTSPRCILVASAVLYDKTLAKAMSKRVMEACEYGAWVILADDDTGLREGGRATFESEWERLVAEKKETNMKIRSQWTHETVQQRDVFGWVDKKVQVLHLNYPIKPGMLE
jgi:predicted nicotinamide N-methyase